MTLYSVAIEQFRLLLWERGGRRCGICGDPLDPDGMHIDHIIPSSMGGRDELVNFQASHARCNIVKGGKNRIRGRYKQPKPSTKKRTQNVLPPSMPRDPRRDMPFIPDYYFWEDVPPEHRVDAEWLAIWTRCGPDWVNDMIAKGAQGRCQAAVRWGGSRRAKYHKCWRNPSDGGDLCGKHARYRRPRPAAPGSEGGGK